MSFEISLIRPDDWHLHLRDGAAMASVLPDTARQMGRAIVMPNLSPPVVSTEQALAYAARIRAALPDGLDFAPLMTLYLTDVTPPEEIRQARDSGQVQALKLYPAGATTNSEHGVTDIRRTYATLEVMQELGMPLLVHGEVTDAEVDVFHRERVFIEQVLAPLLADFPGLKLVFEHITTEDAVDFVLAAPDNVAATITAHHLLLNRNALFAGGIRPHHYCLPVLKAERHRQALLAAATGGGNKFFLGTDSAPHSRSNKESACGCAGMYTAFSALELYAEVFDKAGALAHLEAFASFHGPDFYGLPRNTERCTLVREAWQIPALLPFGEDSLVPFRAGESLSWRLKR